VRTFRVVAITLIAFLLAVLVLSYAFVRSEGLSARNKPSNFEYAIANFALGLSIPSEAKKFRNPLGSEPQILAEARKQYKDHCAVCHAENGGGNTTLSAGRFTRGAGSSRAAHTKADGWGNVLHHKTWGTLNRNARLGPRRRPQLGPGDVAATASERELVSAGGMDSK
jgi:mono/diheme cytochrome c family protein